MCGEIQRGQEMPKINKQQMSDSCGQTTQKKLEAATTGTHSQKRNRNEVEVLSHERGSFLSRALGTGKSEILLQPSGQTNGSRFPGETGARGGGRTPKMDQLDLWFLRLSCLATSRFTLFRVIRPR